MKTATTLSITLALTLLLLIPVAFFAGRMTAPSPEPPIPQVDTVWVRDTIKLTDSKPAGSVVATLPIVRPARPGIASNANLFPQNANLFPRCADTLHTSNRDSLLSKSDNYDPVPVPKDPPDSVAVEIPIEQRTYEGEYYRAVVQGYQPELVSIDIRIPATAAPKRKWLSVTVGPQLGYGFTPAGWQPYAGIGITVGITF